MPGATQYLVIGRIAAAFGIKGWLKVQSFTDPQENLLNYRHCHVCLRGQWREVEIDAGQVHGTGLVVHVVGVDDRTTAEQWLKSDIGIDAKRLPELDTGEFYWHQLMGLRVYTAVEGQDVFLGCVDHLLETGANDVLVVRAVEGSIDKRERLIPAIMDRFITNVDLAQGQMHVDWDPEF